MADPIVLLYYESSGAFGFDALERLLADCGLRLRHPKTGDITRRSEIGEQVESSSQEILELGQKRQFTAMDFWVDEQVAAHVSTMPLGGACVCESIAMDTLDDQVKLAVSKAVIGRFRSLRQRRMLVVDLIGDSLEFVDWAAYFCSAEMELPSSVPTRVSPTVLGIEQERFKAAADRFENYRVEHFDGVVLAYRPAQIDEFPSWRWECCQQVGQWVTVPPDWSPTLMRSENVYRNLYGSHRPRHRKRNPLNQCAIGAKCEHRYVCSFMFHYQLFRAEHGVTGEIGGELPRRFERA